MADIVDIGKATWFKSGEHAAKNGAKGGKASGKARREKRTARQMIEEIVGCKPQLSDEIKSELAEIGLDPEGKYSVGFLTAAALMRKALSGDVKAIRLWLEITGEDPKVMIEQDRLELEKKSVPDFAALDAAFALMGSEKGYESLTEKELSEDEKEIDVDELP